MQKKENKRFSCSVCPWSLPGQAEVCCLQKVGSILQNRLLARFSLGLMGLRFTVFNLFSDGHSKYLFHAMFNFSTAGISVSRIGNKPPVSLYDEMLKTQLGFNSI